MKKLGAYLISTATLIGSLPAWAEESLTPMRSCNLTFQASGAGVLTDDGRAEVSGLGQLSCYDLIRGSTEHFNISVRAHGSRATFALPGFVLSGTGSALEISTEPQTLLGHYQVVHDDSGVDVGTDSSVGFHLTRAGFTLQTTIQSASIMNQAADLQWVELSMSAPSPNGMPATK